MNTGDNVGLTDFLVIVFKFCKRNLVLVGISTLIGLTIGLVYSNLKPKYYSSEMIGYSELTSKTTILEIFAPLTSFADEKNHNELAKSLDLSLEQAEQIRSIDFTTSKHTKTSNSPSTDKQLGNLILTTVTTYDQSLLPKIESGLISYIERNNFLQNKKKQELLSTNSLITEISERINTLDSLYLSSIKAMNQDPNRSSTVNVTSKESPIGYIETFKYLEDLRTKVVNLESYTIVNSFYHLAKPANKNVIIISALTLVFFVMGLLIAFLREIISLAKKES